MSSPTPDRIAPIELSNEVRMLIAFVLMGLILVATPYVYRKLGLAPVEPPAATRKEGTATTDAVKKAVNAPPPIAGGAPMPTSATSPSDKSTAAVAAPEEQDQVIDTSLYHVVLSNRGAVVKSWTLKDYKDAAGKPLEVINLPGAQKEGYPFSLSFRDKQPSTDLNEALWVAHPEGLSVRFDFSDGQTTASKTFAFVQGAYLVQYADQVVLGGNGLNHLVAWRGGFGDMAVQNAAGLQAAVYYDLEKNKLNRNAAKSAKNGPVNNDGKYSFAGLDDQYFAAVFLAPPDASIQTTTFDDISASAFNTSEEPYPGVAVGGTARNQLALYLGPKEINLLHSVNPKLDGLVDWGFFGVIAKPLFLVLHWMNDRFIHNYGWAIIVLTIIINLALFPLKLTNLKSMRKMQKIQPEINKLTEKYKGIGMSDPRSSQKQQEMMDLYKKHGVNPMGGCIPMIIQLPFLWAFYKVLAVTIEMRHASWLWVGDLSQPEHFSLRILPVVLVGTGFLLQKMTPTPTQGDASQQKMMQFMPLMMGFFFWSASSGLVLYWLTGNLVGIAQQWFFNTTAGPVEAAGREESYSKGRQEEGLTPKYSVSETGPRISQFLRRTIDTAGFELDFIIEPGDHSNPDFENPDLLVKFSGGDVELLLANRAELLLALELITQEALRLHSDDHSRISFDANDYRALRIEELRLSAMAAAEKVKKTGTPFRFNPMNSRERRVIHIALRNESELRSESSGAGPFRGVIIYPAGMASLPELPPPTPSRFPSSSGGGARPRFGDSGGNRDRGPRDGPGGPRRPGGNRDRGPRPPR